MSDFNIFSVPPFGVVLHEGNTPSGHPFFVVATLRTTNRKTGDMVQVWIMLKDVNPVEAVQTGLDASTICRSCPFSSGRGCYVNIGQAPLAVWRSYHKGIYPKVTAKHYRRLFYWRKIRFGAYGNPTLIPLDIVQAMTSMCRGWTGYFHDWKENPEAAEYAKYFMASTETESSLALATSLGYRTFHVSTEQPADSVECLADADGRSCTDCMMCMGLKKPNAKSVWINPHGSRKNRAIEATQETTINAERSHQS